MIQKIKHWLDGYYDDLEPDNEIVLNPYEQLADAADIFDKLYKDYLIVKLGSETTKLPLL
jgi:hypothetical protein